jgi:hypothetical protein
LTARVPLAGFLAKSGPTGLVISGAGRAINKRDERVLEAGWVGVWVLSDELNFSPWLVVRQTGMSAVFRKRAAEGSING